MGRFEERMADSTEQRLLATNEAEDGVVFVKAKRSRWSLFRSWFGSFALGVVFTSIVFGVFLSRYDIKTRSRYSLADNDPIVDVPSERIMFKSEPLYSERPSDDTDLAWDLLLPSGRGFVFVPDSESRGLPPGQSTPYGDIYSVSMFHQLHCLARLRMVHWLYQDGINTGELGMARAFSGRTGSDHIQHCLDYLRQAILCAGDMTLEWPKLEGSSSGFKVDGWNITHTCKARSAINDYMEKYHYNESLSIDAAG